MIFKHYPLVHISKINHVFLIYIFKINPIILIFHILYSINVINIKSNTIFYQYSPFDIHSFLKVDYYQEMEGVRKIMQHTYFIKIYN